MKGVPTVKLEDGGKRLVVEQKIVSKSKPTAMWYFGNKPIKAGGRYFLDVAHEEDTYVIVMEISMVNKKKIMLSKLGYLKFLPDLVNFKFLQKRFRDVLQLCSEI